MSYEIKRMSLLDVEEAIEWAAAEGWNPGLGDAPVFYSADSRGFFMAFDGSQPVGVISAVAYDDKFGFIGFFIVRPDLRGHLIGAKLGQTALEYLGDRNIGVDGVEDKMEKYTHFGFMLAYHNYRYGGRTRSVRKLPDGVTQFDEPSDFVDILAYDRLCFPAQREKFMRGWLGMAGSYSVVASDKNGRLQGFATARKCRVGYKIAPLFADDVRIAEKILAGLQCLMPAESAMFLDIPGPNKQAIELARSLDMECVFGTARMYSKCQPDIDVNRIFGVTSFELG
ncbi:MAG TPA: GNAT family N-acetyltransferase [Phycisphaerae bacterium]|nr:GNAT family N-acetyltransferase [Phycisphaerae bacterium]HPS53714.1 GNAT family N-acetyltransferase [Phycisphaerae bacterium]